MRLHPHLTLLALIVVSVCCYGCTSETAPKTATTSDDAGSSGSEEQQEQMVLEMEKMQEAERMKGAESPPPEIIVAAHSALKPAPFYGDQVSLSGDNTSIGFLGTKPDGDKHAGGFGYVQGKLSFDMENKWKGLALSIVTKSLWSDDPKLTAHLKSPDFFNVNEHPRITFQSTSIREEGDDGHFLVTGDLMLLGVTKEISMPVLMGMTRDGATVTSEFKIDRTEFGMNYGEGKIDAEVGLTVVIGKESGPPRADQPTDPKADQPTDPKADAPQ